MKLGDLIMILQEVYMQVGNIPIAKPFAKMLPAINGYKDKNDQQVIILTFKL